jgi:ribosomal protein L40E
MAADASEELRPIASLLARLGGVLILLGGVVLLILTAIGYHPVGRPGPAPHSFWAGIVLGFIAIVLGFAIYALGERLKPGRGGVVVWSVLIIVLAAISLAAAGWLTAIGFIFALIAALLGILWALQQTARIPAAHLMMDARACLSCGAINSGSAVYCQKCGKPLNRA